MTVPAIAFTDVRGPADAPLVVLGPSLGTSSILWEDVVPSLAASFRVTAWDLPGHGDSEPAREPFSVADVADAVAEGIRARTDAPALYAGVSLGGAVGLELELRHPELLAAAAIIASGAELGDSVFWDARAEKARTESTSSLVIGSAQRWFAPESVARRPELSGRLLHSLQDADDESYALCSLALGGYDVRDRLGEIATPTLALWGEYDAVAPEDKAREIAEGVRDGRLERIADAAHLPPAEQPVAVSAALLAFFSEHDRRSRA